MEVRIERNQIIMKNIEIIVIDIINSLNHRIIFDLYHFYSNYYCN